MGLAASRWRGDAPRAEMVRTTRRRVYAAVVEADDPIRELTLTPPPSPPRQDSARDRPPARS